MKTCQSCCLEFQWNILSRLHVLVLTNLQFNNDTYKDLFSADLRNLDCQNKWKKRSKTRSMWTNLRNWNFAVWVFMSRKTNNLANGMTQVVVWKFYLVFQLLFVHATIKTYIEDCMFVSIQSKWSKYGHTLTISPKTTSPKKYNSVAKSVVSLPR